MSIRRQMSLLVIVIIVSFISVIAILSRTILVQNFISLENDQAEKDIETVVSTINNEIDSLTSTAGDWAEWDDTYQFIFDHNPEYIENNLFFEAIAGININFIIFIQPNGEVTYYKAFDLQSGEEIGFPQSLITRHLLPGGIILQLAEQNQKTAGLLSLNEGLVIFASNPVLTSQKTGPPRGALVIGRFFNEAELSKLSKLTSQSITIFPFTGENIPADFLVARDHYQTPGAGLFIRPLNADRIAAYSLIKDIYGNGIALIRIDSARDLYYQGRRSFGFFAVSFFLVSTLMGLLILHGIDTRVIKRLEILGSEVQSIGQKGRLEARVSVTGKDELALLENSINKMLNALEKSDTALRENEERLRLMVDGAEDIILLQDLEGRYLYYNGPSRYGQYEADILGKKPHDLFDASHAEEVIQHFREVIEKGEARTFEQPARWLKEDVWFSDHMYPVKDASGKVVAVGTISRNITSQKVMEDRLRYAATHDSLTNLPNRVFFMEKLHQVIQRAGLQGETGSALLFLDLDRFKNVNDSLGHAFGDQILLEIATRLRDCLRPDDIVARLGGDEFGVLLRNVNTIQDTTRLVDRILQKLSEPSYLNEQPVIITASIGIVQISPEYNSAEDVLRDGDAAMYLAKAEGKACYRIFDESARDQSRPTLKIESSLRRAIENNELLLHYQPVVSATRGNIKYLEALLRWKPDGKEMIPPSDFIPLAEETGLILPIGEWVLRQSCTQLKRWREEGHSDLQVAVNISARQLYDQNLPGLVKSVLKDNNLPGNALQLEITESVAMRDFVKSALIFDEINKLGVQITIDDFGTSYSSLNYLHQFPVSRLKIDRSFLRNVDEQVSEAAIAVAIIAIGHLLGLEVVAEGVETKSQLSFVIIQQCNEVQGYLISYPLPVERVSTVLSQDKNWISDNIDEQTRRFYFG